MELSLIMTTGLTQTESGNSGSFSSNPDSTPSFASPVPGRTSPPRNTGPPPSSYSFATRVSVSNAPSSQARPSSRALPTPPNPSRPAPRPLFFPPLPNSSAPRKVGLPSGPRLTKATAAPPPSQRSAEDALSPVSEKTASSDGHILSAGPSETNNFGSGTLPTNYEPS